ncbi:MAG: chemotaxis protein CheW, partial [Desulfobulbaceae bacterium]|nr:chemotaxis protein CheW [Desulfobulbaceae bacterium]
IFNLADERYGVGVLDVREIIGLMEITELPNMPSFFEGVINLRDKVIPVLDMRAKFGMERAEHTERTCIVVVEISGLRGSTLMGVIVDGVSEVANVRDAEVEDAPVFGQGVDTSFILGIAKLEAGVTILLDIDRILHTSEMVQLSGVA